jgi:DNA-binding PadR family transcriptional regulator
MPKINKTKYALLGVLNLEPGSGYDIKKFCDFSISHFWNENYGHIYPVLKQMEAEKLVTRNTEHTEGKPDRNVYFITNKGKSALHQWLMQSIERTPARSELLLKIFFSTDLPIENTVKTLLQNQKEHEEMLAKYKGIEQQVLKSERKNPGLPFWLATLKFGKHHAKANIEWCKETVAMLKEIEHDKKSSGH